MLLQERFQQFGRLASALASTDEDHRLASVVVDRPDAVALFLGWAGVGIITCWPFGLHIALRVGIQLRLELLGIVEDVCRSEVVAGLFERLFLRVYSGSGLVMVCWGRLKTIPAAFKCSRTVSYSTRMPVSVRPCSRPGV
jgi:hypothetical protein